MAQNEGFDDAAGENDTVIRVVGVGGGGGNAINRMIDAKLQGVDFIAINTDRQDIARSNADIKIELSDEASRGLGAGANPEKGAEAAKEHEAQIQEALQGSDMVFITCGEGGGTGTGASPLVAHIAKELGALTVAVVTRPFSFEGVRRSEVAEEGIEKLKKEVDAIIVIPNDRLCEIEGNGNITLLNAFSMADSALIAGIEGITGLINSMAYINVDFEDVKAVLQNAGTVFFGMATADGEDRALKATEKAISSPLIEENISGAHGALVIISGSEELEMSEVDSAMEMVKGSVSPEAQIIMGVNFDNTMGDQIKVTVIVAGFESGKQEKIDDFSAPLFKQKDLTDSSSFSSKVPPIQSVHLSDKQEIPSDVAPKPAAQEADDDNTGDIDIPPFLR
ncbi:MAG: cell division protein FtsZ [Aeriscardovia sp.]|nr:cell division protein FtsZ [Aeriscardovia sp.]MBO6019366.1 cell division protein FtsZ [Aeriscardovia sp.]MBO6049718.1 cell division protein FtsZ [Aeriscardovia sp.]MBO6071741.1 cell division protein FtsZ [Aeriscardovia sp.]MBO7717419.1 cell division protein FtsZ [Aeriscardovia sp.]